MKTTILLIVFYLLASCSNYSNNINENIKNSDNVQTCDWKNSLEQCSITYENHDFYNDISWDEDTNFDFCDSISKYWENSEFWNRSDFLTKWDSWMLMKKIDEYNDDENNSWNKFPIILSQYCKSEDWTKFIFSINDKVPYVLWMYDKELDIIKKSTFKYQIFPEIAFWNNIWTRYYGDISLEKYYEQYLEDKLIENWFVESTWNIIEHVNYWVSLIWKPQSWIENWKKILTEENLKYCSSWLTNWWKLSVCFADVYYKYDLSENTLYEDKICSYYIDDNWEIKKLQDCIFLYYQ